VEADAAHRAGVVLSLDHPSRVRVSIEGDVALAFPATMPGATPEDDLRGIGASLYALLIDRWPLPEGGEPSGLEPADRDPAGNPVEPKSVAPEIPFQISAAAVRAVQADGGITSAATLLGLLQQITMAADQTELISPIDEPAPVPVRSRWRSGEFRGPSASDDEARSRVRRVLIILTVGGAILVVALLVLAWALKGLFANVGTGGTINAPAIGANTPTAGAPSESAVVKPIGATVFPPGPGADSPGTADLAIDGDATTAWSTDVYSDSDPFPGFKSGVGLMLQLSEPARLSAVDVKLSSTGTEIQICSSTTETPATGGPGAACGASANDITKLSQPTPVQPGVDNRIPVTMSSPTSYVLVWISKLGHTNGKSQSSIFEIRLEAAH
jgi:putative peptidoglycan lipid II flippase